MMNDKVYKQNLEEKETMPGGPFLIQMLFKEQVSMPDKETMTEIIERHCGETENFCYDEKTAGFTMNDYIAEFKENEVPVQLMITACNEFDSTKIDSFIKSQMWDCMEDRDRILSECNYQVIAFDFLASGLQTQERANFNMDALDALAELYPTCEAFYFQKCGKLVLAEEVRNHTIKGIDRFIRFGVNARFFNIQGTEDMIVDTVGMSTLFLPDLQYHFHNIEPNWVVNHAYNLASYLLQNDCPINDSDTVDGIVDGNITRDLQWGCQYEESLIQPARDVLDINMGEYASGQR